MVLNLDVFPVGVPGGAAEYDAAGLSGSNQASAGRSDVDAVMQPSPTDTKTRVECAMHRPEESHRGRYCGL